MLTTFVLPCYKSPHGHLRAKACWLSGVFCDVEFPEGKGTGPTYFALFQQCCQSLSDPELPVRVAAVVAIRNFVEEVDNEDLVFTLEAIVEKFGPEIAPFAAQMTSNLAASFWKYANPDAGTDEEEDEDDMSSIAAYGCLKALNTLLESVNTLGELYPVLEESLFPIMQRFLSTDGQDVFEEVLEMMAYFTFYSPTISDRMWLLWPQIHSCLLEWGIDYWENILVPLDNMISRDTARFIGSKNPDYLASVYQMVQHSLSGDYDEADIISAPKLMEVVLQSCRGAVDQYVAPYMALALAKLNTAKSRSLKDLLVTVVANALYYNPALALATLSQSGAGAVSTFFGLWFGMIFATRGPTTKPKHFRGVDDDEDEDADADDAATEAYMRRLAQQAKQLGGGDQDDDDDSDDEWTDDEEAQTPIDPIDPFLAFGDALNHIQAAFPQRYQTVAAVMDPASQTALQAILAHAQKTREEAAAKALKQ
eukprot:gene30404-35409_t